MENIGTENTKEGQFWTLVRKQGRTYILVLFSFINLKGVNWLKHFDQQMLVINSFQSRCSPIVFQFLIYSKQIFSSTSHFTKKIDDYIIQTSTPTKHLGKFSYFVFLREITVLIGVIQNHKIALSEIHP